MMHLTKTLSTSAVIIAIASATTTADGQSPPIVDDRLIGAGFPGEFVTGFISAEGDQPITWSGLFFHDFVPLSGHPDGEPFHPASFDVETQYFTWDSSGSPNGIYEWRVTATNQFGSDQGSLFVTFLLPNVPEPSSALLAAILAAVFFARVRRR
jgi:hypothetical protein